MNAREYLQYFRVAEERLKLKAKQVQDLRDQLTSLSSPMDQEVVSHTRNVGAMSDTIAVLLDMQKEIDQQTKEIVCLKKELYHLLDEIAPDNAMILMEHYLNGKSLTQCGKTLHIVKRQAQRKLNDAIDEFQKVLNKGEVDGKENRCLGTYFPK